MTDPRTDQEHAFQAAAICHDCEQASVKPWHAFTAGCRGCCARALARSPHFRRVRDAGSLDRQYRAALAQFGLEHAEVRAAAERDREQRR